MHQRSTESKDLVLAAASCITAVQMPASSAALPLTASPYSRLQSALVDSSVLPAQQTKNSGISFSVTAGLQRSSIDWEGTFCSSSAAHGGDTHDPAAYLTTCIKHSHPLAHKTVRNSSANSDAMQSDQQHSDSADDSVSDDATGQLQKWSLSEQISKKTSIPSKPLSSEDVTELESLKYFKQMKEALDPDKDHVSSSCQLNNLVLESKNVLSENYARVSSIHIYEGQYKKAGSLAEMMQKDHNTSSSTSVALSGQTTETMHLGREMLPVSQKPDDVTGCHTKKACTQTTWQTSVKKSVCQSRCSSSEDSDDGNMNKNVTDEQQKRHLYPAQLKKCFTEKRSNVLTSERTNSDSALLIKGKEKKADFKKANNSFSLQVCPKPASVGEVNCSQSAEPPFERCVSSPTQQAESAVLTYAWADSPLPLSERLKGRIKIN